MKQPRTQIAQLIADRSLKQGVSERLSREVAAYLLTEGRTAELESLLRDVQADWAERGHVEVLARSAHPIDVVARQQITVQAKRLYANAKQIIVTEVHDPTVLAGVQLNIIGEQLDLTAEAKLNKFKQLTNAGKDY